MDGFPVTRHSAITGLGSREAAVRERSYAALVSAYWKPVYTYLRLKWRLPREDAQDVTQGFFLRVLEQGFLAAYDPTKGRFRTYLRTCLDGYAANERKSQQRLKRGGDTPLLSLEFERAEGELRAREPASAESIERHFEEAFARSLFELALAALRADLETRGRTTAYAIFERYDVDEPPPGSERPSYAVLARELGLSVTAVTHQLALARREFRRILLQTLREITASDEEFRLEARQLLGLDA